MTKPCWTAAIAALALIFPGGAESQSTNPPPPVQGPAETREVPLGEGVICTYAIYTAIAEVGARCRPGQDVEFQAELKRSVSRIEQFILENSHSTQEQLTQFKKVQGLVGAPDAVLCRGDILGMYDDARKQGADKLRGVIDKAVSRPGTPTWGTCL